MSRKMTLPRAVHVNITSPAPPTRPELNLPKHTVNIWTHRHRPENLLNTAGQGRAQPSHLDPGKLRTSVISMGTEQLNSLTWHWTIQYLHQGPTDWELLTGDKGRLQLIRVHTTRPIRTVVASSSVYLSGLSSVLCLETAPHGSSCLYCSALHRLPL